MLILTTKLKNAINKKKPGMEFSLHQISVNGNKRGTSGWIRNPENNSVVYVNTEGLNGTVNLENICTGMLMI